MIDPRNLETKGKVLSDQEENNLMHPAEKKELEQEFPETDENQSDSLKAEEKQSTGRKEVPWPEGRSATGDTFMQCWFSGRGRLNRKTYIIRLLITAILLSCLNRVQVNPHAEFGMYIGWFVFSAIVMFSMISIQIRRCHDLEKHPLFWLLTFVPILNLFISIYLMLVKGNPGSNKYGPDPLISKGRLL